MGARWPRLSRPGLLLHRSGGHARGRVRAHGWVARHAAPIRGYVRGLAATSLRWRLRLAAPNGTTSLRSVRSPATTSSRRRKPLSSSTSHAPRSNTSRRVASSRRAVCGAVGSSFATGSPPPSRRSASLAPGDPRTQPPARRRESGAQEALSATRKRYPDSLLTGSEWSQKRPSPYPCRDSKKRERRDSNPRPRGVTDQSS